MSIPGNLYVVAAPSGTGKTTLVKALVESVPHITVSISHSTRPKRPLEIDGVHYYFIGESTFRQMIEQGDFLEYATVFHNLYGTSKIGVEKKLAEGQDVILEIDWQGCQQIKALFPDCIAIFILPPSLQALALRLKNRNQDRPEIIAERLQDAKIAVSHIHEYDYVIINADFDHAVKDLQTIVYAARLLQKQQTIKYVNLLADLTKIDTITDFN